MNVLSLFDGISCGQVALQLVGIHVDKYFASEIDDNAIKITQKNFPNTIQLGDINKLDTTMLSLSLSRKEKIDLIFGGFPCQDLSICTHDRKCLAGTRSGLFFKMLDIIREVKPAYFLVENVASMPEESKRVISDMLGVEPIFINSADVSAQSRKRLYWTNIPFARENLIVDKYVHVEDLLEPSTEESVRAAVIENKFVPNVNCETNKDAYFDTTMQLGNTLRLDGTKIVKSQGGRVYSTKGKSVSLCVLSGGGGAKTGLYKVGNVIRKLTPIEAERCQCLPDNYTAGVTDSARYKAIGNGWTVNVIASILVGLNTHGDSE